MTFLPYLTSLLNADIYIANGGKIYTSKNGNTRLIGTVMNTLKELSANI